MSVFILSFQISILISYYFIMEVFSFSSMMCLSIILYLISFKNIKLISVVINMHCVTSNSSSIILINLKVYCPSTLISLLFFNKFTLSLTLSSQNRNVYLFINMNKPK